MNGFKVFTISLIVTFANPVLAQSYSLKDFLKRSLEVSKGIQTESLNLKKADFNRKGKNGLFLPNVNLTSQYSTDNIAQDDLALTAQNSDSTSTKINLSQNLFNGLRDLNSLQAAKAQMQAQELRLEEARATQVRGALTVFFNLLQYQQEIASQTNQLKLYEKNLNEIQRRIQSGSSRPNEATSMKALIANTQTELSTSENNLKLAEIEAAKLLQVGAGSKFPVTSFEAMFSFQDVQNFIAGMKTDSRPELKSLAKGLEVQTLNKKIAQGAYSPTLDLSGSYNVQDSNNRIANDKYSAGVVLTIPFPLSYEKSAEVSKASVDKLIAENQLAQKKDDLESQRLQLIQNIQNNLKEIELLKMAKELNSSNVQALTRDHRNGVSSLSEVITASITYQQTVQKYDRAVLNLELNCYQALFWSGNVIDILEGLED